MWAYIETVWCYTFKNIYNKALEMCKKIELMFPEIADPWANATLAYVYATIGKRDKAEEILELLNKQSQQRYMDPYNISVIYIGLGDKDEAFKWLEKAYKNRSPQMMYFQIYSLTWFKTICDDPRYKSFLKRMRLNK